jgi:hypothetical protein
MFASVKKQTPYQAIARIAAYKTCYTLNIQS